MEIFEACDILKMETTEKKTIVQQQIAEKCRMCLKIIKSKIPLSENIRTKFLDLTQMELSSSEKFSIYICSKCDKDIRNADLIRKRLIDTQLTLCEETGEIPKAVEDPPDSVQVVKIKQEQEENVVSFQFLDDDEDDIPITKPEPVDPAPPPPTELEDDDAHFSSNDFPNDNYSDNDDDYWNANEIAIEEDKKPDIKNILISTPPEEPKRKRQRVQLTSEELDAQISAQKMVVDEDGKSVFVCDYCGKNITTAFSLREHILTQHMDLEKIYNCTYEGCEKSYATKSRLRIHLQTHKDDKKAICPICGTLLSSKRGVREHIRNVHTKVKKFFCDHCDFGGTLKSQMRIHMKVHIDRENRRIHKCHICGFVSSCPKYLRKHLFAHRGIEFPCEACGKVFNYKGALQVHFRAVHKKVKPHVCEVCGKPFYSRGGLATHVYLKHSAEPVSRTFPCEVCGKLFALEMQVQQHMQIHLKRIYCTYEGCTEYFNTEKRLKKHIGLVHEIDTSKVKVRQRKFSHRNRGGKRGGGEAGRDGAQDSGNSVRGGTGRGRGSRGSRGSRGGRGRGGTTGNEERSSFDIGGYEIQVLYPPQQV